MLNLRDKSFLRSLALAIFAGIIFSIAGYYYGSDNQIEQLPIVMRAADPGFLRNDFFTNVSEAYGPRFLFAQFIVFFTPFISMEVIYFLFTLLANIAISVITFLLAREIFQGSSQAGALAACFVMAVRGFDLGGSAYIRVNHLVPTTLAMPFVLGALWAGLRRKPVLSIILSGSAALFQPLLGLETGFLMLAVLAIEDLLFRTDQPLRNRLASRGMLTSLAVFLPFIALAWGFTVWVPGSNSAQTIDILAKFRHPHHYLPSTFGLVSYLEAFLFLTISGVCFAWWKRSTQPPPQLVNRILLLVGTVLALCIGGYVFVEVLPTRIWTAAQTFRLLFIPKWLGLIMLAGAVTQAHAPVPRTAIGFPAGLLALLAWQVTIPSAFSAVFLLAVYALQGMSQKWFYTGLGFGLVSLGFLGLFHANLDRFRAFRVMEPKSTLAAHEGDEVDISRWARANTPEESIFLTPPDFGQFRFIARRAIVVDFKAFPFQEEAIVEWKKRLLDCYGATHSNGYQALEEMEENYRQVDDRRIRLLQPLYGFQYAVLYQETPTAFPVLYENDRYKVILVMSGDTSG